MVDSGTCLVQRSNNLLLRRLSSADQALLNPAMREATIACGQALLRPDANIEAIHFPTGALISIEETIGPMQAAQIAIVGREGLVGWPALLGTTVSPHGAVARGSAGTALRIGVDELRAACAASPSLMAALLRFVHVMMVQMSRTMASHLQHSLDQRVACWLLMRHDRLSGDVLMVRHDEIADCLNARRASITDRLHVLEGEHLIRCHRGRIIIRDRPALERFAGAAYGSAEAAYRALIAPFGKSAPDAPLPLQSPVRGADPAAGSLAPLSL